MGLLMEVGAIIVKLCRVYPGVSKASSTRSWTSLQTSRKLCFLLKDCLIHPYSLVIGNVLIKCDTRLCSEMHCLNKCELQGAVWAVGGELRKWGSVNVKACEGEK